jgi:23S rRNA pseudouridine2605 synthase
MVSKMGLGSRTDAARWVTEGRVRVNGKPVKDPEHPVILGRDKVSLDDRAAETPERLVVMLNKPAGLVTTLRDERGRDTVYRCFEGARLPWLAPVGRLDKSSEGLLLFTNDPVWAAAITRPHMGPHKTYHVQIDRSCDPALAARLEQGLRVDGELLRAFEARCLPASTAGTRLELVLDEGRNRHIRRLLGALGINVLRLQRVRLGALCLGDLPPGAWRRLDDGEIAALRPAGPTTP